jgi:hypothetical protein
MTSDQANRRHVISNRARIDQARARNREIVAALDAETIDRVIVEMMCIGRIGDSGKQVRMEGALAALAMRLALPELLEALNDSIGEELDARR